MFQETFKVDSREGGSRVSKRSSKDFLREFHGSFNDVLRVFKDSVKSIPRRFQIKFQEFSRMFN